MKQAGSILELSSMTGDETAVVVWDGIVCQGNAFGLMETGR